METKVRKFLFIADFLFIAAFLGGLLIDTLRLRSVHRINTLAHWFIDYLVFVQNMISKVRNWG